MNVQANAFCGKNKAQWFIGVTALSALIGIDSSAASISHASSLHSRILAPVEFNVAEPVVFTEGVINQSQKRGVNLMADSNAAMKELQEALMKAQMAGDMNEVMRLQKRAQDILQGQVTGQSVSPSIQKNVPVKVDSNNLPTVLFGSLMDGGVKMRPDGRFSVDWFRILNLPPNDENGNPVDYSAPMDERIHVELTGPESVVLSDHYYSASKDGTYAGWVTKLSMQSPQTINRDFVKHKAILKPGAHKLRFYLEETLISVFNFDVEESFHNGKSFLRLNGPWNDMVAIGITTSLHFADHEDGAKGEYRGSVKVNHWVRNERGEGLETLGQHFDLILKRNEKPYAVRIKSVAAESLFWQHNETDWMRPYNREPGPGATEKSYNQRRDKYMSEKGGDYEFLKTERLTGGFYFPYYDSMDKVLASDFEDGKYELLFRFKETGQEKVYKFERKNGEFVYPNWQVPNKVSVEDLASTASNVLWVRAER